MGRAIRWAAGVTMAALGLLAGPALAAGVARLTLPAAGDGPAIDAVVWTPCAQPAVEFSVGPFTLSGTRDCPVQGQGLGLIVVSHGFQGNALGHRDTAQALADAGHVVVAPNHPDDTTANRDRSRYARALLTRPRDVERVLDFMLQQWSEAQRIDPRRVGLFGFSRGATPGSSPRGRGPTSATRAGCAPRPVRRCVQGGPCRRRRPASPPW